MRGLFKKYPRQSNRLLEIAIPSASWIFITMPFWLSFWHPAIVAYLIITFDIYWFYKSITLAFYAVKSYITLVAHSKINWLDLASKVENSEKIYHLIIIPEYKEPLHILRRTLSNLESQKFPKEKLIVVLATEAKDPDAVETASILKQEYGNKFGRFFITRHTLTNGETAGKSSNMAWAAQKIYEILKQDGFDITYTTVTSCDADAILHPSYFAYLTVKFLNDPDRYFHFYQGAILFYSNIWRIPLPNKIYNTICSIGNLSVLSQGKRFINFSTYSLSFKTVVEVGYWDVDVIPEDYHLFFKVYFHKGQKTKSIGLFLPVMVDAAESHGFYKTFVNQYEQSKRWAWGVSDIPFVITQAILHPEIPRWDRLARILLILEHHIFWPANWFILTIGSTIPPLINPAFDRTTLGHNLSKISSGILTMSAVLLLVIIIIDLRIKPPRPKDFAIWKLPFLYAHWLTLPIISFFLSALPGLDAHTRLILGKRLEYRVTEKV